MRENGFSLIEVLVAVALLALISLLVWQSSGAILISKERVEKRDEVYQEGTLALSQLLRDLEGAYLYSSIDLLGRSPQGEQRTKTVFIGTDQGDQDRLVFSTLSHVRYLKDAKESDQAEVSYFLEQDPEDSELWILKKRESSPPDSEPEEGGAVSTLVGGVRELNLRYYDLGRGEFFERWDSTGIDNLNTLPRVVEILLVLQDPVDEEGRIRLLTSTLLEMAPGPSDF